MSEPEKKAWHDNLPFPKHWIAYIVLKIVVLGLALFLALRWKGLI
jgi:hypothetical protein